MVLPVNARRRLETTLHSVQAHLEAAGYIRRAVYREDANPQQLQYMRGLGLSEDIGARLMENQLVSIEFVALIGDAGSGKSLFLKQAYLEELRGFLDKNIGPCPVFLDLDTQLGMKADFEEALQNEYPGLWPDGQQTPHREGYSLYLDSLDQALLFRPRGFIKDLHWFLKSHRSGLRRVVIACRRSVWRLDLVPTDPVFTIYHADYLDSETYDVLLPDPEQRKRFWAECDRVGARSMLARPFDGFYLARLFRDGKPLPPTRRQLVDSRIEEALRSARHGSLVGTHAVVLGRLRGMARRLALMAVFSTSHAWTEVEAFDMVGAEPQISTPMNQSEVVALLQCPLFHRSGERFGFSHQIDAEFLAAEEIKERPVARQRQLLQTHFQGRPRVLPAYYGVTAFLAEMSEPFRHYLLQAEPEVILQSDAPLSLHQVDCLLRGFTEKAVSLGLPPWYKINPYGDDGRDVLRRHRPADVPNFICSYLVIGQPMALLWATACAVAWGGHPDLNQELLRVAFDTSQHEHAREWAVEAIAASGDREAIVELEPLFDDQSDLVRGEVLAAFRRYGILPAAELLRKLRVGERQPSLLCGLQVEAGRMTENVSAEEWPAVQEALLEIYESMEGLRLYVVPSLLKRAGELGDVTLSEQIFLFNWKDHHRFSDVHEELMQHLGAHRELQHRVWDLIMEQLAVADADLPWWQIANDMTEAAGLALLDWIPASGSDLSRHQRSYIDAVVHRLFLDKPVRERLALLNRRVPEFSEGLRVPRKPRKALFPIRRMRSVVGLLHALLKRNRIDRAHRCCVELAGLAGKRVASTRYDIDISRDDLQTGLAQLPRWLVVLVLKAFRSAIMAVQFRREKSGSQTFTHTWPWLERVFQIVRIQGVQVPADKLNEILKCYGFVISDRDATVAALQMLHHADPHQWEECIHYLCEDSFVGCWPPLNYLTALRNPLHLDRCLERLKAGSFQDNDLPSLLAYAVEFGPEQAVDALRQCYVLLQQASFGRAMGADSVLWVLLTLNDAWAWRELAVRIASGDAPGNHSNVRSVLTRPLEPTSDQMSLVVEWYGHVKRRLAGTERIDDLSEALLKAIRNTGGPQAIHALERLRQGKAFPGAEWLSHLIHELEWNHLNSSGRLWAPDVLLQFVCWSRGMAPSNHGLFEVVCEVLEEIKHSCEVERGLTAAFWDSSKPKTEPICQGILWDSVKTRLSWYPQGTIETSEKLIGTDLCDLWVECRPDPESHWQVALELKTARKGYGPKDLVDPVETQLWEKYMCPASCRFGIYVVLWFRDDKRYRWPRHWASAGELLADLQARAEQVGVKNDVTVRVNVIDLSAEFRTH